MHAITLNDFPSLSLSTSPRFSLCWVVRDLHFIYAISRDYNRRGLEFLPWYSHALLCPPTATQTFAQLINSNCNLVDERGNRNRNREVTRRCMYVAFARVARYYSSTEAYIRRGRGREARTPGELTTAITKLILYIRAKTDGFNTSWREIHAYASD